MKLKKLFAASALLVCSSGAWAQTDVTSTYLTNANFEADEALTGTYLYGYGKDGTPYGLQAITGWTSVVTAGDNSNNSYPNSGMAGGVFSYGSSTQLKGNSKAAPATNPDGEASGNCLGFFGVWSCGGYYYQNVTLAAGKYTITVPMYNQSGTQANTTYTGFFPTSGTNKTVAVNPTVGQWVNQTVTFTLADATEGQIRIGYQSTGGGSGANPMLFIDCVKIEFTAIVVRDVLETAITAATTINSHINNSDLTAAITTAQGVYDDENATQEGVNNAAATLNTAVETAMAAHIANGGDPTLALANSDLSSLDGWTVASTSGYNDKGNGLIGTYNVRFSAATVDETHLATEYCLGFEARWSGNYASYNQTTVALPAGVYTLTYDVENVNGNTSNLTYADYNFVEVGGTKNYSSATEWMAAKSGWTTHTIRVTLNEPAPITVSFGYGTGDNNSPAEVTPALYVSHVNLSYSSFLDGAKAELQDAIAAAPAVRTANIGDGAFQIKQAGVTAYSDALDAATAAKNAGDATIESINAAKTALATAIETYNNLEVNKPDAEKVFNVVLTETEENWQYANKAMTYLAGDRNDMGNYNIKYRAAANINLAQAFTFTWVIGNNYKMSQIDADGNTRYLCTGVPYGGGTGQLRTTTTANDALEVKIIPTDTDNIWYLYNTADNNYIGSQDEGVFTVNRNKGFNIVETSRPSITINTTAAGWGTVILPFTYALPEGVKAYTCEAVDGNTLTLVEKEGALEANKPYIIEGSWEDTVTGDAQGTALTYTEGLLTGVYETQDAPEGKYILQKQGAKVGFYLVDYTDWAPEAKKPELKANRAYLTAPSAGNVKAFFFDDTTTGINAIMNEIAAGKIYDLGGRKVSKMQKGQTYIVGDKKVTIK